MGVEDGEGRAELGLTEHMALILGVMPVMVYRARGAGDYGTLWVSENAHELTGFTAEEMVQGSDIWFSRVHPTDQTLVQEAFQSADVSQTYSVEYRWQHREGYYVWFLDHGRRRIMPGSDTPELFGVALDTSARHAAQAHRERLLEELINAQEVERQRISRELHDALGQTMTSMIMRIAALQEMARAGRDVIGGLTDLKDVAGRAAAELSSLAHTLRPPVIDELGFMAALHNLVSEFASYHRLAVDVHVRGLEASGRMAPAIETSLYRMVQEALNNVVKHSGAGRVSVILDRRDGRVSLIVEDDGCGFDIDQKHGGLGLSSMRERAAILGGKVAVESRPGGGTTVRVVVPKA